MIPAGTVVEVPEADYMYGTGDIRMRLDRPVTLLARQEWAEVTGVLIGFNGRETVPVTLLVRVTVLREAVAR